MSDMPPDNLLALDPSGQGMGGIAMPEKPLPRLSQPAEVEALDPGSYFLDAATGKRLQRPYDIPDLTHIAKVPEGSNFRLPGQPRARERPKTFPLDSFGAETLYGLAGDDAQRRKVLEVMYGKDRLQEEPGTGETLVKGEDGRWLRPGKGLGAGLGWLEGAAAPGVLGAAGGALAGGTTGLMTKNPWLARSAAVAGGGAGMGAGRAFNNMILGLFGITSSADEERAMMDEAVKSGMLGEAGGRAAGAVLGGSYNIGKELITGTTKLREAGPRFLRYMTGTNPEEFKMALSLRNEDPEKDIISPVSSFAHEVPMLKLTQEELDPMFRESPTMLSRERYYERTAADVGEPFQVKHPGGSFLSPERAVDFESTGFQLQEQVAAELAKKNAALDEALAARTATLRAGAFTQQVEKDTTIAALESASADLRKTATEAVDAAFAQFDKHAVEADTRLGGGPYPGEPEGAHKNIVERLHQVKGDSHNQIGLGINGVAARGYNSAYALAGNTPLFKTPLEQEAKDYLLKQAPGFENEAPGIVQKFESISKPVGTGRIDPATGEEIMQVPDITLDQAHSLLKWANAKPNWNMVGADAVEGAKKHMAGMLQRWLHDPHQPPAVQAGVRELDRWNSWYKNAMAKFDQRAIVAISREMDQNRMVNAPALAKMIFEEGDKPSAYNLAQTKKLIGGQRFRDLLAIDMKRVMDTHKDSTDAINGVRLANDVADRLRRGVWPETEAGRELLNSANKLALLQGGIKVEALPGDTISSVLKRTEQMEADIAVRVKQDPMTVLEHEMTKVTKETAEKKADALKEASGGPLGFLARGLPGEQSRAAGEAARQIIENPHLIGPAAERFGANSEEFKAIRQSYVQSVLQDGRIEQILRLSDSTQDLLLPGMSKTDMIKFARTWQFLKGSGGGTFGGGLAATSRVTNPLAELSKLGGHHLATILNKIPILGPAIGRQMVGAFYHQMTDKIITNIKIWRYMAHGMESADGVEREKARIAMQAMVRGTMEEVLGGIGVGLEALNQRPSAAQPQVRRAPVTRANMPLPANSADQTLRSLR